MNFRPTNGFLLDEPIKRLTPKSQFLHVLEKIQQKVATDTRFSEEQRRTFKIPNRSIKDLARSPR